jgi:hypothetical protein
VFSSKSSPFYEEFLAVANYLREEPLKFIHTFKSSIGKSLGVNEGDESVIVRKAHVFISEHEKSEAVLTDVSKSYVNCDFCTSMGIILYLHSNNL